MNEVLIHWPHRQTTRCRTGCDWLEAASEACFSIPTGCLGGSSVRACIATVPASQSGQLTVELAMDPSW